MLVSAAHIYFMFRYTFTKKGEQYWTADWISILPTYFLANSPYTFYMYLSKTFHTQTRQSQCLLYVGIYKLLETIFKLGHSPKVFRYSKHIFSVWNLGVDQHNTALYLFVTISREAANLKFLTNLTGQVMTTLHDWTGLPSTTMRTHVIQFLFLIINRALEFAWLTKVN